MGRIKQAWSGRSSRRPTRTSSCLWSSALTDALWARVLMRLRALELDEFRSFRRLELPISPAGFRAIGPNASGKSTILEAIAMLATTRSPRTAAEREIAHWDSGVDLAVPPYARLRGEFERSDGIHQLEIGMTLRERGHNSLKKMIRFDDQPVRAVDAV